MFVWVKKPDFKGGTGGKIGSKLEKLSFFQGNQGQLFQFCPGRIEAPFYTFLTQIILHFIQNVPENIKKPIILTFFQHFPKFVPLPLRNFGTDPKFDHILLCVYY